ncbi:MAG: nucleotidyltransferase family protein [Deltaproteobacteria bacterium]|nr:nucleotidyltransferase family protein [Deltaproteobacteria bacterium]
MDIVEIRRLLGEHKPVLAERFKVSRIGVFGSYARGEQDEGSDVDVLVEFSAPVGFFAFLDLEEYLAGILGRRVDLVSRRALKPCIGRNILHDLVAV